MVGATVSSICACIPIQKNFDETIPGHCYDATAYIIASVCIVIITDIMVVIMPTWMIYDLHMKTARKVIIIAFLSFGLAVIAIGVVRLEYLIRLFVYEETSKYTVEQTYSAIESNLAIIGACGPTIKWMLGRCIPFLDATEKRSTGFGPQTSSLSKGRQRKSKYGADPLDGDFVPMGQEDLMYMSKNQDTVELRDGTGWKTHQGSIGSDERSETTAADTQGIVKTVEWNVASGDQLSVPTKGGKNGSGFAVRPADVV